MARVTVIGTTSWGTTLAILLANNGSDVALWARTEEEAAALRQAGENPRLPPGSTFPAGLRVTASLHDSVPDSDMVVVSVPSRSLRENMRAVVPHLVGGAIVLSATKGLENESARRMSEVMEEELPEQFHDRIGVLSGPNLAREIVRGMPASTVIASRSEDVALRAQELFMSPVFRVYTNADVVGVELGGALKNIIALGAGICDGLGYGDNGKAAFITRGLVEMTRLAVAAGANPLTLAGSGRAGRPRGHLLEPAEPEPARRRAAGGGPGHRGGALLDAECGGGRGHHTGGAHAGSAAGRGHATDAGHKRGAVPGRGSALGGGGAHGSCAAVGVGGAGGVGGESQRGAYECSSSQIQLRIPAWVCSKILVGVIERVSLILGYRGEHSYED